MSMQTGSYEYGGDLPQGWVMLPDGGIVPTKLDRESGWLADEDRDSTLAARLRELVTDMDVSVAAWLADSAVSHEETERIMGLWVAIRKITQGRDITEVTE